MGLTHEHALSEAVRSQLVQIPNFARSSAGWHGLRNAYREPERLGVDRWLAISFGAKRDSSSCTLPRSEEHTSELQSLMRISYAVFCLKKKNLYIYIIYYHSRPVHL